MFSQTGLITILAFAASVQGSIHERSRARSAHVGKRRLAPEGRGLVDDLVGDAVSGVQCGPAAQLINGILSIIPCPSSSSSSPTSVATSTKPTSIASSTQATSSSSVERPSSTASSAAAPKPTCDSDGNLLNDLGNIVLGLLGQPQKCAGSSSSSTPAPASSSSPTSTRSSATSSAVSSAPPPAPTCDTDGNLLDDLGNVVLGLLGQPKKCNSPSSSSDESKPSSTVAPSSTSASATRSAPSASPTCDTNGNLLDDLGNIVLGLLGQPQKCSTPSSTASAAPSSTPNAPSSTTSSADPAPTCDSDGNLIDDLGKLVLGLLGQKQPCTPSSSTPVSSSKPTSNGPTSGGASSTTTSKGAQPTCDSDGNLLDDLGNLVLGLLGKPKPCNPSTNPSSAPSSAPSSVPTSVPTSPPSSAPSSIDFPTMTFSSVAPSSTQSETISSTESVSSSAPSSSIDSAWLNIPSSVLLQNSVSSTASATLTNPDQASVTLSLVPSSSPPPNAPLPPGIPLRILPPAGQGVDANADHSAQELVSILFDNSLGWNFEVTNSLAPGQIFVYFPQTIANALGIPVSQIETLYLQAYKPTSYTGPQDINQLGTMYLGYLPNGTITQLAAQVKARNSPFYTNSTGVPAALAAHVDSSYSINNVVDPNSISPDASSANGSGALGNNQTKQDVIIGVVSSLAGIALIILAVLVYKSHQRRQELAHRRLSDSDVAGIRPTNRDFDQDTVGNPRRRSFFFAQDSLGGPTTSGSNNTIASSEAYSYTDSPEQMRERRPINAAQISTPQLQQSSMNW